jgi:hypothetical protein
MFTNKDLDKKRQSRRKRRKRANTPFSKPGCETKMNERHVRSTK